MKYEAPQLEVIEFETSDIIQTSGNENIGGGGPNETPFNPASVSLELDENY